MFLNLISSSWDTTNEAFSNLLYGNKIDETKNQTLSQKLIDNNLACFKKTSPLNLRLTPDSFRVKFLNNLIPIFKKKLTDDQDFVLNQDSALKNLQIRCHGFEENWLNIHSYFDNISNSHTFSFRDS